MRFSLLQIPGKVRFQIEGFLRIKPVPQLDAWRIFAQNLKTHHHETEAAIVFDLAALHYDKSAVRKAASQVLSVPDYRRGRGLIDTRTSLKHPAVFDLRDQNPPVMFDDYVGFRAGSELHLIHPVTADSRLIQPFVPQPAQISKKGLTDPWAETPISFINIQNNLIFAPQTNDLYFIDMSRIDFACSPEEAENRLLPYARIQCNAPIHRICGPLDDGTFFATMAPDFAALSDKCFLFRIDIGRIQEAIQRSPGCCLKIEEVATQILQLQNIEQTLRGDISVCGDAFITCGGGMQAEEVRFIHADGSWAARCVHTTQVLRILQSEFGPVSLDAGGQAFRWDDGKVVGDMQFSVKETQSLLQSPLSSCSIDWQANKLYVTCFDDFSHLFTGLSKAPSACMDATGDTRQPFIQKLLYLKGSTIAMLSDGNYYFWDSCNACVLPPWQLSQNLATAEDLHEILSIQSPALEDDPRIRIYE